jgi:hypothetical protein
MAEGKNNAILGSKQSQASASWARSACAANRRGIPQADLWISATTNANALIDMAGAAE